MALRDVLKEPSWQAALNDEFDRPYFLELERFLTMRREAGARVLPAEPLIFRALNEVSLTSVRAVIVGQDPYPTPGDADGLAFSSRTSSKLPQALKVILKEVQSDLREKFSLQGDLSSWAGEGVLLLNTVLTVEDGAPGKHKCKGWESFTMAVLCAVRDQSDPSPILLWGKHANDQFSSLWSGSRHLLLPATYPGHITGSKPWRDLPAFVGSGPFSRANEFLRKVRGEQVDWVPRPPRA